MQIRVTMQTGRGDAVHYDERFTLPVKSGTDHIEALAMLVVEISHLQNAARKTLAQGIEITNQTGPGWQTAPRPGWIPV